MEYVILVDENDQELGTYEKLDAHKLGLLHRAFSVLLFNDKGQVLLQKRSATKYHSAGLWTNTCCSHPRPGESIKEAARRRLREEMGINASPSPVYSFIYKTELENGLIEHELDHVLIGIYNGTPDINRNEVDAWKFESFDNLMADMQSNPQHYTFWFKEIIKQDALHQQYASLLS
jgi:isopentenyl-diphosphate delta-isomerase